MPRLYYGNRAAARFVSREGHLAGSPVSDAPVQIVDCLNDLPGKPERPVFNLVCGEASSRAEDNRIRGAKEAK
jgi:hypothetical protein